jgi:sulfite reductase beta subunit-like hemoprotein
MGHETKGKTIRKARACQLLLDFSEELGLAYAQLLDRTNKLAAEILEDLSEVETEADLDNAEERRRARIESLIKEMGAQFDAQAPVGYWQDRPHKKTPN